MSLTARKRLLGGLSGGVAAVLAASCGLVPVTDKAARTEQANLALAIGETAMWYRFTFTANYRGAPFSFDQYVHCGVRTISGGPFGSAPAVTNRVMYPRTVGRRMADGSYVVIRVPDMCQSNRAQDAQGAKQVGWASRGPYEVLPMVVWNDRRPETTVVEQYVARGYYTQPGARITDPRGSVELMPVGFHPANYQEVLDQPEWSATDPDENVDPATGKRYDNSYASNSNGLAAFYTVPTVDMAAALARLDESPEKIARELDIARIENMADPTNQVRLYIEGAKKDLGVTDGGTVAPEPAEGPTDPQVTLYSNSRDYDVKPLSFDPAYLPSEAIGQCIASLEAGVPVLSNVPSGRDAAAGLLNPQWVTRALARAAAERERSVAACAQLDRLVSYDVRNGRLDAAGAIPGAIVRRQWRLIGPASTPTQLEESGAARRVFNNRRAFDYRFRFGAAEADLRLTEPRYILHDRANGRWLALFFDRRRIVSDRSVEGGW